MTERERILAEALKDVVADARGYERFPLDMKDGPIIWSSLSKAENLLRTEYPEVASYSYRSYDPTEPLCPVCKKTLGDCKFERFLNLGKER